MVWREFGDVPDLAVDDYPAVLWSVVFGNLLNRYQLFFGHLHGSDKSSQ